MTEREYTKCTNCGNLTGAYDPTSTAICFACYSGLRKQEPSDMTDNAKAPASQVGSSDRAREEFSTKVWVNTNGNAQQIASNAGFPQHPTVIAMVQSLLDEIDSQRLALEEKGREISRLESVVMTIQGVGKIADRLTRENEQLQSRVNKLEQTLEISMMQTEVKVGEINRVLERERNLQGENTGLQSRVKELEARIQHMDNASLDNFGVTITSILD